MNGPHLPFAGLVIAAGSFPKPAFLSACPSRLGVETIDELPEAARKSLTQQVEWKWNRFD